MSNFSSVNFILGQIFHDTWSSYIDIRKIVTESQRTSQVILLLILGGNNLFFVDLIPNMTCQVAKHHIGICKAQFSEKPRNIRCNFVLNIQSKIGLISIFLINQKLNLCITITIIAFECFVFDRG